MPLGRSGEHSQRTAWFQSLSPILVSYLPIHLSTFQKLLSAHASSLSPKGQPVSLFSGSYHISISRQLLALYESSILSQDKSLRTGVGQHVTFLCVCAGEGGMPRKPHNSASHWSLELGSPPHPFTHFHPQATAFPSSRPAPQQEMTFHPNRLFLISPSWSFHFSNKSSQVATAPEAFSKKK